MNIALTEFAASTRPVAGLVVSTSTEGTATVVALRGDSDSVTLPVLVDMLARVIADHDGPVVIDLAPTTFIDTATVRALDRARRYLGDRGRALTFRSPSRLHAWMLAFFGLSHLVEPAGASKP